MALGPLQVVLIAHALWPESGRRAFRRLLGRRRRHVPAGFHGHGWRCPGCEIFVEPGLVYTRGASTFSLHVPIGVERNREPNPDTGRAGDATFPDYITLASYSYTF